MDRVVGAGAAPQRCGKDADGTQRDVDGHAAVVGRFAPTPSGRMHLGNVVAMLAAWLSARSQRDVSTGEPGRILLRIEDVDKPRAVADADRWIMDDLAWLGLDWDGAPVYQSERGDLYESALRSLFEGAPLLAAGERVPLIYPCFCSRADIRAASAPQEGDRFLIYPGTCRRATVSMPGQVRERIAQNQRHAWRIAVPAAGDPKGLVRFDDRVFGAQRFDLGQEVGDTVVLRSDGLYAYQLAVVVDDVLMGVNEVVRGRDLLRSSALQIWIREALLAAGFMDADIDAGSMPSCIHPAYAHLPLIDSAEGERLAKRKNSLDLGILRDAGVRPEQVVGYSAWLLGLVPAPVPMTAREALAQFSWDALQRRHADIRLPADELGALLSV